MDAPLRSDRARLTRVAFLESDVGASVEHARRACQRCPRRTPPRRSPSPRWRASRTPCSLLAISRQARSVALEAVERPEAGATDRAATSRRSGSSRRSTLRKVARRLPWPGRGRLSCYAAGDRPGGPLAGGDGASRAGVGSCADRTAGQTPSERRRAVRSLRRTAAAYGRPRPRAAGARRSPRLPPTIHARFPRP